MDVVYIASVMGKSILFTADISSVYYVDVYTLSLTSKFRWKSILSHGELYSSWKLVIIFDLCIMCFTSCVPCSNGEGGVFRTSGQRRQ